MDYSSAFAISAAGMKVEQMRVDVTSLNLANVHTTRAPDGTLYQPLKVVSQPKVSFSQMLQAQQGKIANIDSGPQVKLEQSTAAPKLVQDPGHPQADENGFVEYPNVNPVDEMVNLVSAQRAYEANVRAFNAAKTMALRALQIGGNK